MLFKSQMPSLIKGKIQSMKTTIDDVSLRVAVFLLVATPQTLMAKEIGEDLLDKAVKLTTNVWALSAATIAIAIVGYKWLFEKQIDKGAAIKVILGIALIFGGPTLVDELRDLVT